MQTHDTGLGYWIATCWCPDIMLAYLAFAQGETEDDAKAQLMHQLCRLTKATATP